MTRTGLRLDSHKSETLKNPLAFHRAANLNGGSFRSALGAGLTFGPALTRLGRNVAFFAVVKITGIAVAWIGSMTAFGEVVGKPKTPDCITEVALFVPNDFPTLALEHPVLLALPGV